MVRPVTARCARRGAVPTRTAEAVAGAAAIAVEETANAAGGAVVETRRNLVYGLHAVNAVLTRSPERLLEIWLAQPRDDARMRELKRNAEIAGVYLHAASTEALAKLVGDVNHQGAVASIRPLKAWDENELTE